jgi:hypothetical protein
MHECTKPCSAAVDPLGCAVVDLPDAVSPPGPRAPMRPLLFNPGRTDSRTADHSAQGTTVPARISRIEHVSAPTRSRGRLSSGAALYGDGGDLRRLAPGEGIKQRFEKSLSLQTAAYAHKQRD